AADAAAEAATARAAAAGAAEADAQAKADARGARSAADAAAGDAAIAGRSAADARADANRAAAAAQAAERDAATARSAATTAETEAIKAQQFAEAAQRSADSAATAAEQALQHAIDAQKAAYQAEDANRAQTIQWLTRPAGNDDPPDSDTVLPYLTPAQVDEWNHLKQVSGEDIMEFLAREGEGLLLDLTGVPDLIACFRDGDIEACLWSLLMFVPWTRLYTVAEKLGRIIPKLLRFFEESLHAVERLNELREIAEHARQCRNPHSFLAGTRVLLADSSTEPIEDVDVGDLVLATDPATGVTAPEPVTQLIPGHGREELVDLTVADADGVGRISSTAGHLFWRTDTRKWVEAGDLRPGNHLRTSSGAQVELLDADARLVETSVYNFEVAKIHTYFVMAGSTPLLVHNVIEGCNRIALGLTSYGLEEFAQQDDINATTSRGWPAGKEWYEHVRSYIDDGSTQIVVNLDGTGGTNAAVREFARAGALLNPSRTHGEGSPQLWTNWELWMISQNSACWNRVTFYRSKFNETTRRWRYEPVSNPFE
ncbi:polymorphic toxin-type HINT domain-containing protein, partial [Actinoplanes sp. NPDC026623]|uniref:polymorphic toxin-type HINT domain-containing protein n=1 Tax=Actinoplanes sp. NPDC026623 TaxID=3155610 RepID=UPI0033F7CCA1